MDSDIEFDEKYNHWKGQKVHTSKLVSEEATLLNDANFAKIKE